MIKITKFYKSLGYNQDLYFFIKRFKLRESKWKARESTEAEKNDS